MEQITEQTIINAIVALDVAKLKELSSALKDEQHGLCATKSIKVRAIGALSAAGLTECPEVKTLSSEIEEIDNKLNSLCTLHDYATRAIKNLE